MVAVAYIAKNTDDTTMPAKEIAKHYKIPLEYLLKIMHFSFRYQHNVF